VLRSDRPTRLPEVALDGVPGDGPRDAVGDLAAIVLDTVRQLVADLHPGTAGVTVHLDSALDADLGLDSLSVAELRARLEQACEVRLPDQALTLASTPADWVDVVVEARGHAVPPRSAPGEGLGWRPELGEPGRTDGPPGHAGTRGDVLGWHLEAHPLRVHVRLLDHSGPVVDVQEITYATLAQRALGVAQALAGRDVTRGDPVAIMLPTGADYFATFLGTVLAGGVPVPLYPPARPAQLADHLRRQVRILDNARAVALVTVPEARGLARLLHAHASSLRSVVTPTDLSGTPDPRSLHLGDPDDITLLQYTSGSTGDPKGVVLSHAHLLLTVALDDDVEVGVPR